MKTFKELKANTEFVAYVAAQNESTEAEALATFTLKGEADLLVMYQTFEAKHKRATATKGINGNKKIMNLPVVAINTYADGIISYHNSERDKPITDKDIAHSQIMHGGVRVITPTGDNVLLFQTARDMNRLGIESNINLDDAPVFSEHNGIQAACNIKQWQQLKMLVYKGESTAQVEVQQTTKGENYYDKSGNILGQYSKSGFRYNVVRINEDLIHFGMVTEANAFAKARIATANPFG